MTRKKPLPALNPIFHQPVRTRLAILLHAKEWSFTELKVVLEVTDGNLDAHLGKLSGAGYLHSRMVREPRPHTVYTLSKTGSARYHDYLKAFKQLVDGDWQ